MALYKTAHHAGVLVSLCLILLMSNEASLLASEVSSGKEASTLDSVEGVESVFRVLGHKVDRDEPLTFLPITEENISERKDGASSAATFRPIQDGLTGGEGIRLAEIKGFSTLRRSRSCTVIEPEEERAEGSSPVNSTACRAAAVYNSEIKKIHVFTPYHAEKVSIDSFFYIWGKDALTPKTTIPSIGFYKWPHYANGKPYEEPSISYHFNLFNVLFYDIAKISMESSFIRTKFCEISAYEILCFSDIKPSQDLSFLKHIPNSLLTHLAQRLNEAGVLKITAEETTGKFTAHPIVLFLRDYIY